MVHSSTSTPESLRDAEALAEALDDRQRLGEISQSMINFRRVIGDCPGALEAGQRARAIDAALGNPCLEIRVMFQLGLVYRQLGQFEPAIAALHTVVGALRGELLLERFGEPSVLSVHARSWLAMTLSEVGAFPEGIAAGQEAIRIAEHAKNAYSLTNAHLGLGTLYMYRGDVDRAVPILERSVSLCQEGRFHALLPSAASALGAALSLAERVKEALPLLKLAVESAIGKGLMGNCSVYLTRLGQGMLLAGCVAEAQQLAVRALETAQTYRERGNEARALFLLAEVAARNDRAHFAASVEHFAAAMAVAQLLGMRPLIARGHRRLGEVYRLIGQSGRATEHVRQAATMLRDMGMRSWLETEQTATQQL